jgi:two-component system, OmpR family, sensor histidine kinase MprB
MARPARAGRLRLWAPMSLRGRMALTAALAVFIAVIAGGAVTFTVLTAAFIEQADQDLATGPGRFAGLIDSGPTACSVVANGSLPELPDHLIVEVIQQGVTACTSSKSGPQIALSQADRVTLVAARPGTIHDGRSVSGQPLRVLATELSDGSVVLAARDLEDIAETLQRTRRILIGLSLVAALVALVAGWQVARTSLQPVADLAAAAAQIAWTKDLSVSIQASRGRDSGELARLAEAFNGMITALRLARDKQAQLVADAGHELRTPLTSLRTNIDLLVRSERSGRSLPDNQRAALLADLTAQVSELSTLAGELTVLAGEEPVAPRRPVRLDQVTLRAVERAQLRADGRLLMVETNRWTLVGDETALERAVLNLLDNAVKFSPAGSAIKVRLAGGRLTVDDAGPGIPVEQHELVTQRFWRAEAARGLPGSGLGLSIVADTVQQHHGSLTVGTSPEGGMRVTVELPGQSR